MPLSEHEQRLLEQMERALSAEDPKFASALRGSDPRVHYRRRILLAAIGLLVGVVLLVTGVLIRQPLVSVAGFLVMFTAVFLGVTSWRQLPQPGDLRVVGGTAARPAAARRPRPKRSLMTRLEERWERRRDERDR